MLSRLSPYLWFFVRLLRYYHERIILINLMVQVGS